MRHINPCATLIYEVLVILALGLRVGYNHFYFLAGPPYWEKVILCRQIMLFFDVITTDTSLAFVPSRPSEVGDQTLCSIPGYLPTLSPKELCHYENLTTRWMARMNFLCMYDPVSIQELIFLWFSLQHLLPPFFQAENATHLPCLLCRGSLLWPGESKAICVESAGWGYPAWSSTSHPVALRGRGTILLIIHLGYQSRKMERSQGAFIYSIPRHLFSPSRLLNKCYLCMLSRSVVSNTVTPLTVGHQTPLYMWILQAWMLEWVAMPFSRGSSWPRDQTLISFIADGFFTTKPPGKPKWYLKTQIKTILWFKPPLVGFSVLFCSKDFNWYICK